MSAFLFALVASFLLSAGGRDQRLVANLRTRLGPSTGLLLVALACAALTGALAGWAGGRFAGLLSANVAQIFVALALLLSAVELAWPIRGQLPHEPTRSLVAQGLVLLARQASDAARLVVFALGVTFAAPSMAAAGGALGGAGAMAVGYTLAGEFGKLPLRWLRLGLACAMVLVAATIAMAAFGLVR